ncbi:MAG: CopG family ribbon-helix-helix protein [Candidatus Heimdallarchaeota archaeon]
MLKIPIISISINENLKQFINKLVSRNQYENKSKIIRDALLRLMSTMDISNIESFSNLKPISKKILGNMVIVTAHEPNTLKKLNKIEMDFNDYIVSKHQHFQGDNLVIFMLVEANVEDFQKIVVEINGIEDIKNFRYAIVN